MKIRSINSAGWISGASVALIGFVCCLITGMLWWKALALAVVLFAMTYTAGTYVMRKFVIYKIKPIYQIVLSKNIKTKALEYELAHNENPVEGFEGEIATWAEKNRREIARLKENEKFRKEYIGNVAHEIKTPIFNIQGYISTLLDGGLEDEGINRTYLERAEKSIDRLINIVTDLDQISKLESGTLRLHMERFDVLALARDTAEVVEMDAIRRGIKITIGNPNSPAQTVFVKADKHYISQVLVNLLTNSVKYGNDKGWTKISFVDLFDKVMVEVSDNGVGIAKEDIPRVFERFYRTDKSRSREQGGTGLGLAIVKHILEAHDESITLRSEPGKGSTFAFTLTKA